MYLLFFSNDLSTMDLFLEEGDEIQLSVTKDESGNQVYILPNGVSYDNQGKPLKTKIETGFTDTNQLTQRSIEQTDKQLTEPFYTQATYSPNMPSDSFMNSLQEFTDQLMDLLFEKFDGKTVGGDEMTKEMVMKLFFEDDLTPSKGKKKKKACCVTGPKKKKALSGYTYFQKQNKEKFNEMIEKLPEKPKYVSFASAEWKKLTQEQKEEWNVKAKEAYALQESEQ